MIILYIRLKAARKRVNLTQTQVARILNVFPSTVNRWESGERTPSLNTSVKLAELCRTDLDYLSGLSKLDNFGDLELDEMQREMVEGIANFSDKQIDSLYKKYHLLMKNYGI